MVVLERRDRLSFVRKRTWQPVLVGTYTAGTTSATISGLTAATTYSFELVAYNSSATASTAWVQATTPTATTTVSAPQNLTATATSSSTVQLSWSASTGATGYRVYEYVNGQAVQVASLGAGATSTTVSGVTPGTTDYFFVSAYNSTSSGSTSWVSVTMPSAVTTVVSAPTSLTATATSSTTAQLSWAAASNATGYQVFEYVNGQAVQVASVAAGTTTATISGLTPGTTDYFYVTAYNATSAASTGWVSVIMPSVATATLTAPTVTAVATTSTTGTLSWTASAGATGYEIVYWNGRQAVLLGTASASTTSVTISGMNPGSTYYFAVIAYNSTTNAASAWASLTEPTATAARLADILFSQEATAVRRTNWLL